MPVINSLNNFRVLQWLKLKDRQRRNSQKLFVAEGWHLVSEAYKTRFLNEIITTEKSVEFDAPTYQVTYEVMEKLSSLATPTKIMGVCRQLESDEIKDSVLLVDQVHHPGNLGTIIRNAAAFGVDTVALDGSVDVYNQKVIQATRGMLFHVNIVKKRLNEFIVDLKRQGYLIIGADANAGVSPERIRAGERRAVLVGNEAFGAGGDLLGLCDAKVRIEMSTACDSLNVGVATGIILYCLNRNNAVNKTE